MGDQVPVDYNPGLIGVELVMPVRLCAPNGPAGPLYPDGVTNGLHLGIGCP